MEGRHITCPHYRERLLNEVIVTNQEASDALLRQELLKSKVMYQEEREGKEKEQNYETFQLVMQTVVSSAIKMYGDDFVNFLYTIY